MNFNLYGDPGQAVSNTSLIRGEWYLIVGTYDGSDMKLYIDGNLDAQSPNSGLIGSTADNELLIGIGDQVNEQWKGNIGSFAIWERAITENEIEQLEIDNGAIKIDNEEGLIGSWKFNQGSDGNASQNRDPYAGCS